MKRCKTIWRSCLAAVILAAALSAQAAATAPSYLIPGGSTVGIKMYTQGLVITELVGGSAAARAGLKKGDTILEADGKAVDSAQALTDCLRAGRDVVLTVMRDGKRAEFLVSPSQTENGCRLGVYIRDSIAGIGTVTYYDPLTGAFGALGHGVNDLTGSRLLPLEKGFIVSSSVAGVKKGCRGTAGQLHGVFDVTQALGTVEKNTERGLFGTMATIPNRTALPVADSAQVKTGAASILSNVDGTTVEEYAVHIDKLYPNAENGRNLLLTVTDERLLEKTGGIVQGMSGSPIIQDGKLIGAVTHVLVNDPTRGYGIFIENMLEAAG